MSVNYFDDVHDVDYEKLMQTVKSEMTAFGNMDVSLTGQASEDFIRSAASGDERSNLNDSASGTKPEFTAETSKLLSYNDYINSQETMSAEQAGNQNITADQSARREFVAALKNDAISLLSQVGLVMGENGPQMEVQVKVSDLKPQIQSILQDAGYKLDTVTLVKDLIKNEMYVKFDMDSSHIENYMGKEFMQQLSGIVDVSNLKTNIVEGTLQGKLYLDNKGNVIDRGISFQMKVDGLVDAQAKAVAKAFGADVVNLDLRQSGKGTMTLASKLNADEIVKNLTDQGLGKMADTLAKSISGQVLDLAKVSNVTMALNIEKVNGQLRTTNIDKVEYAVGVDNLRDGDAKAIASALGVTSLTLTTDSSKEGAGRTFISDMKVNGENVNDSTIAMVMEKDTNLGNMLKSIQSRVMQNGIIDPKLVNFEIKNAVNYQGKIITTIAMSTPFDNIKPGSGLDVALDGKAKLSNQGMAYFAMTSMNPGEIVALKPPAPVIASEAKQSQPAIATPQNISARNDVGPKPPSSQDLRMDMPGPDILNPGFKPPMPFGPTAFFFHEMAGLGDFYQAFDIARSMSTPNSFAQNLADVMATNAPQPPLYKSGGANESPANQDATSRVSTSNHPIQSLVDGVKGLFVETQHLASDIFSGVGKLVGNLWQGVVGIGKAIGDFWETTVLGRKTVDVYTLKDGTTLEGKIALNHNGTINEIEPGTQRVVSDDKPPVEINGTLWESGKFIWSGDKYNLQGEGVALAKTFGNYEVLGDRYINETFIGDGKGSQESSGFDIDGLSDGTQLKEKLSGLIVDVANSQNGLSFNLAPNQSGVVNLNGQTINVQIDADGKLSAGSVVNSNGHEFVLQSLQPNIETGGWRIGAVATLDSGAELILNRTPLSTVADGLITNASIRQDGGAYIFSNGVVAVNMDTGFINGNQNITGMVPVLGVGSQLTFSGKTDLLGMELTGYAGTMTITPSGRVFDNGSLYADHDGTFLKIADNSLLTLNDFTNVAPGYAASGLLSGQYGSAQGNVTIAIRDDHAYACGDLRGGFAVALSSPTDNTASAAPPNNQGRRCQTG